MKIRLMTELDMESVFLIETQCFPDPWSRKSIRDTWKETCAFMLVAEESDKICGYLNVTYILDECNINRIAVLPTFRRQHLGLAFLTELFSFCRMHHLFRIGLEVRASNLPAQNLYRSCGFFSIGERKNLYANPTENGIIMEKILEEAAHE